MARGRRFESYVCYRHVCDGCDEPKFCAVVPHCGVKLRLCRSCLADGFWRTGRRKATA